MTANENQPVRMPNGPGVAALMATGVGAAAMAVLAIVADHSPEFKKLMLFYTPTGPLSGVTTTAVAVWLVCWIALNAAWKRREIGGAAIGIALALIAISFVLMFPPAGELF